MLSYTSTCRYKEDGFSLIELSVVLIIIGLLMGAAASLVEPYITAYRYNTTKAKMEKVMDALALYTQTNYDVPCPADPVPTGGEPFGTPRGSGADGTDTNVACMINSADNYVPRGIVPFKVLGLSEDQVRDAWGSYFTYAIPAQFDRYKINMYDREEIVHHSCRTARWIDPASGKNKNIKKAFFCCPRDVSYGGSAYSYVHLLMVSDHRPDANVSTNNVEGHMFHNNYEAIAQYGVSPPDPRKTYLEADTPMSIVDFEGPFNGSMFYSTGEFISAVLVSQGMNRLGVSAAAPRAESRNVRDNTFGSKNLFMLLPFNTELGANMSVSNYFDDIVVYRTNHQLMSAFGNNSCQVP